MSKHPFVYMLASQRNGTLYIGVTADLIKRIHQHRTDATEGFTKKYQVHDLVWYEQHLEITRAILREKQLKKWVRSSKIRLIEANNPTWRDLYVDLV